jgi:serine/threonine-protein kinase TTK/MPS1
MANGTDDIRALKYVDLQQVDQASEEGIKNEVEHLQSLRGERNIIQMFDYAVVERKMYIVLEYGELDMQKYLHENKGFIDNWQLKSLWRQMVNAVAIVHSKGIIHRDLKPCNFMICRGQMKLIDFGIANSISADATSLSTDMVGTLNYMSPEQLNETAEGSKSVKVGKWSDSWSLGCILYLMAYGKLPFQHIKHNAVKIAKIIDEAHQIEFSPHSCDGLVRMLQICLNRKPKSRLLPQDILDCFFYGGVIQMVKYLDDNQFQELYKTVNKLAG